MKYTSDETRPEGVVLLKAPDMQSSRYHLILLHTVCAVESTHHFTECTKPPPCSARNSADCTSLIYMASCSAMHNTCFDASTELVAINSVQSAMRQRHPTPSVLLTMFCSILFYFSNSRYNVTPLGVQPPFSAMIPNVSTWDLPV